MRYYRLYIVFIILISCKENPTVQNPLEELVRKRELWEEKGIKSYSFTQSISCFCTQEYTMPHKVTVQNKLITMVDGKVYDKEENKSNYLSVIKRFDYIDTTLKKNPTEFRIEYDPVYGFPSYIYFDIDYRIVDEEVAYTFTDFLPISNN